MTRSRTAAAALVGALIALAAPSARAQAPAVYRAPILYDGVARTSVYLPAPDGVRLAVSVYRPTRAGQPAPERLPVIVTQMRSQLDGPQMARTVRYFTDRGYVWIGQDRRGTGASFGRQTGFVNGKDLQDAKAVIDWAAAQPFSSGRTVTFGCSNQGVWQFGVAALAPKSLVAIAPACASPQFFDDAVVMNGVPIFGLGPTAFSGDCGLDGAAGRRSGGTPASTTPVDADTDGALLKAAQAGQACNAPMLGQYWLTMARDGLNPFERYRPAIDDSAVSRAAAVKRSRVAVLSLGGWYDAAGIGQMAAQAYWGGRVIMGPWAHGNAPPPGWSRPNSTLDLNAETLRWFDFHAKGVKNGAERPGVLYYTVNAPPGREWRETPRWNWGGDRKLAYYFGADSLTEAPSKTGLAPLDYAGRDVPWFGGAYAPLRHWWDGDMSAADAQSLSQTGPPLAADLEVTGTPVARLWISANTADANVFAVVEDVGPDGRSTYVTDGHLRASWRKPHASPWGVRAHHWHRGYAQDLAPLAPGAPAELVFDLYPISYVFKAGHRIRVSLVTSIGQAYQAPPLAAGRAPRLMLHRSGSQASVVELPVVNGR